MFSSRFHWDFRPNRLTEAVEARRRAGAQILDLTESNPTRAGLIYPAEILDAFADERLLRYHPAPAGLLEAREAVSGYYASRGHSIRLERILLTASTSEAYAYLFKLLTNPGDHVLVPRPSYPLFEFLAAMESVETRAYPLLFQGRWTLDVEAVVAALTERTRGIILVNPNNPTGSYVKRAELQFLTQLCATRQIALISDEVFSDYAFGPDGERVTTLAGVRESLAFSMSGLSKIAGLPQMKLGWIVTAGPEQQQAEVRERLEWIADTYLSVGAPVQYAAAKLLHFGDAIQNQIRQRTYENLQFALRLFDRSPATVLPVEGGWYLTVQVPHIRSEEEWVLELLNNCNVLLQPGFFYDFESEAFLVGSLLTDQPTFREGMGRLKHLIDCT